MADQTVVLRPNVDVASSGASHSGGSFNANLSDTGPATTNAWCPAPGNYFAVGFTTFAFPAGSYITAVWPTAYIHAANDQPDIGIPYYWYFYPQIGNEAPTGVPLSSSYHASYSPIAVGGQIWYSHNDGRPFTQADIDVIHAVVLGQSSSPKYAVWREMYMTVYYNVRPTTVVTGPAEGTVFANTNSPSYTWTYTDPENDAKTAHRLKVFSSVQYSAAGFDPETSAATNDSGDVTGTALTATGNPLPDNGTYRAYVKCKDNRQWSLWDYNQFSINVIPPGSPSSVQPGAPALTVTSEPTLARIKLDVVEGTAPTVDYFVVERSEDSGITWETVRGANPLLNSNLLPIADAEADSGSIGGWVADTNVAATYPITSVAAPFTGARGFHFRAAAAGDMIGVSSRFLVTPGVQYRVRAYSKPGTTARNFQAYLRWYNNATDAFVDDSSAGGGTILEVAADWRESINLGTCPAGRAYAAIAVKWTACALNEDHYVDTISSKTAAAKTIYDNEVKRRLPANQLFYRARGFRYTEPAEVPLVSVVASPYTANVAGTLVTDDKNWLKSISNPNLSINVRFGFESGSKFESSAKEEQGRYTPKTRGYYVVFGSNTEGEEFDLPLIFTNDVEYEAFETLRKRRETLLLQTRYGDADRPAIQFWIHFGDRSQQIMNTTTQDAKTSRKVSVKAYQVAKPPGTVISAINTGPIDGVWVPLIAIAGVTADATDPPMVMKDSRGVVHLKGRINGASAANTQIATLPSGYIPGWNTYFGWGPTYPPDRMFAVDNNGAISTGTTLPQGPISLLDHIHYLAGA